MYSLCVGAIAEDSTTGRPGASAAMISAARTSWAGFMCENRNITPIVLGPGGYELAGWPPDVLLVKGDDHLAEKVDAFLRAAVRARGITGS